MTVKFDKFKAALEALCIQHGVVIGSELYDCPAIWDRIGDEEPIHQDCLRDHTQSSQPVPGARNDHRRKE
jgi:hypothetical protein